MKAIVVKAAKRLSARPVPLGLGLRATLALLLAVSLAGVMFTFGPVWGVNLAAPPSLKTIPVPEPPNLGLFLKADPNILNPAGFPVPTIAARKAAIALGKALYWDMQVGSDGLQACATCHFHAGADRRIKNQVSPGLLAGDNSFQVTGPNGTLTAGMFPFTKFLDPEDRFSQMLSDANDVVSSQGVHHAAFNGQPRRGAVDQGIVIPDPVFNVGGVNTRRVEPRNTPTVINAVFNFANFWDGRANNIFNGVNPFGDADPEAAIWVNADGVLEQQLIRIPMASLASQAVGPPLSDFEMSFRKRTFAQLGKKMLKLIPLGKQRVHRNDSVLGPYTQRRAGFRRIARKGLNTTYAALIKAAFQEKYWNSPGQHIKFMIIDEYWKAPTPNDPDSYMYGNGVPTVSPGDPVGPDQFSQMEANFSLFFGLALQLYEATLVSDDSPFDRFQEGDDTAMSASAQQGLNIFLTFNEPLQTGGSCIACHSTSTFTNASVMHVGATNFGASLPEGLIERMIMGDFGGAFYDSGYYNIGVRPTEEDLGRAEFDPFGFPLSFADRAVLAEASGLPFENPPLPCGIPDNPPACPNDRRTATAGAFKTPTLRNVELTGPYFHSGGYATLGEVMDFYVRGGNFTERNIDNVDADIQVLFGLVGNEPAHRQVIDFMLALTDERVRWERAPFDHPEILIPNGARGDGQSLICRRGNCDSLERIPAVGAEGRSASQGPLGTFLDLSPY